MDDIAYRTLEKLGLDRIKLVSLAEFEDEELLRAKTTRSPKEYCWTCTSSLILYVLKRCSEPDMVTYLDADLYFFSNPTPIFDELDDNSILISAHNYAPAHDQSATSGIYCVQFMAFKNNEQGHEALSWWRDRCIEWCYARFEDGKFGDQKYLDDWLERFAGVHVIQHIGAGVAPWNVMKYKVSLEDNKPKVDGKDVIFYHFHYLHLYDDRSCLITGRQYEINEMAYEALYARYLSELKTVINIVSKSDPQFKYGLVEKDKEISGIKGLLSRVKSKLETFVKA